MAKGMDIFVAQGKTSGAQTNQNIVIPGDNVLGGAKQRVVVDELYLTLSAAGTAGIENADSHSTRITPLFNLAAGVPICIHGKQKLESEPGEGIDLTCTGGDCAYLLLYHYEP